MNYEERIIDKIKENGGYITTKEIEKLKINRFYLTKMANKNIIKRVKRGVYKSTEPFSIYENEMIEVSKIVPNGVFCLETALDYYELTTNIPFEYKIAITSKSKVKIPTYPPIKIIYFSDKIYNLGISEIELDGNSIKIYNLEKTICDITRYRNKIGYDIFIETIKNYIDRKDKNINKLIKYSKKTKTYNILKKYLEVLI